MDFSQNQELMIAARVDLALRYKEVDIDTQVLKQLLLLVSSPFEEKLFRTRKIQNIHITVYHKLQGACMLYLSLIIRGIYRDVWSICVSFFDSITAGNLVSFHIKDH